MGDRPSSTAQYVALARAHLTWLGVIDDPLAESMLLPRWSRLARALRRRPLKRFGQSTSLAYLAARTLFFDDVVKRALDAGARQVVVLGAGYDSRAWRMARPGVEFFEVDARATQDDKRRRAPEGGPRYVPAELGVDDLGSALLAVGFDASAPTVYTVEGLTMYLTEANVLTVLKTLASLSAGEARIAINFGVGFHGDDSVRARVRSAFGRVLVALGRERFRFELAPGGVPAFVAGGGWTVDEVLTGPEAGRRYLVGTSLSTRGLNADASMASARARVS